MDNYNLSLAGGIIGFIVVFLWKTRNQQSTRKKYLDIIMPSFLIAAVVGFLGAFFGGQIYGVATNNFLAVDYNTKYSTIPGKLFPLALAYCIITAILVFIWSRIEKKNLPDGYI